MAFLEDPRLRQRWNQISQTTETVTENAAAGIWSFGHTYVNPCLDSVSTALQSCTSVCLGDPEERARRERERERAQGRAEYSFDFYDDWDDDFYDEDNGGYLGGWRGEDWDRLLAGTGRARRGGVGEIREQPRTRKRGMSYGTKGPRRKSNAQEDPTVIPSTTAIGFLGRLPWKIGGTLRYKPSAANLQEHPGTLRHGFEDEETPLLDAEHHSEGSPSQYRKRSGTAGSGDTSDSFRSRGDLFPSDGEGEEDAVPLDDEFAVALGNVDDKSSGKTRSSKGKRIAGRSMPRNSSRTTIASTPSKHSLLLSRSPRSVPETPGSGYAPSVEDLRLEEEQIQREEDEEIERKRRAAVRLAQERGLQKHDQVEVESKSDVKGDMVHAESVPVPEEAGHAEAEIKEHEPSQQQSQDTQTTTPKTSSSDESGSGFVPARLPFFR